MVYVTVDTANYLMTVLFVVLFSHNSCRELTRGVLTVCNTVEVHVVRVCLVTLIKGAAQH